MAKDMKVKDYVAQMQSGRSFVKAKMDSAGIGKVHLSFVEHSGRPKCEQVAEFRGRRQRFSALLSRDVSRHPKEVCKQRKDCSRDWFQVSQCYLG